MSLSLPWAPLYSSLRSGRPETTLYGILLAQSKTDILIQSGNDHFPLWGRSLLKPWQLMVIYPVLKQAFPQLKRSHYALMMASQQSDPQQVQGLQDILNWGDLSEELLQCPACTPMKESNKSAGGNTQSPLNHPCSGKHLAYLLYAKTKNEPPEDYLKPPFQPYQLTRSLFSYLLGRDFLRAAETVDGCGMPNMALSASELAKLYQWLATGLPERIMTNAPEELLSILQSWEEIAQIMQKESEFVGGQGRLDTRLMQGKWTLEDQLSINAKEGAEGLLSVGLGPTSDFPNGIGILVKISSGYDPNHLETLIFALLKQLHLCTPLPRKVSPEVQLKFYFNAQQDLELQR